MTTDNHPVDVFAPNIRAVFTSPSKTFGVFNHRLTGVAYTREEEASLGSTDWYKDVPDLFETAELYRKFGPHELPRMYKQQQLIICEALGRLAGGALIKPSDNILMAHTDEPLPSDRPVPSEFSAYASIPGTDLYRFRMSTLFKRLELHNRAKD